MLVKVAAHVGQGALADNGLQTVDRELQEAREEHGQ